MPQISILAFADSVLGIRPYDWQCRILHNHRVSNRFSLAVEPIVSAEEHAEPGTEREMHR